VAQTLLSVLGRTPRGHMHGQARCGPLSCLHRAPVFLRRRFDSHSRL